MLVLTTKADGRKTEGRPRFQYKHFGGQWISPSCKPWMTSPAILQKEGGRTIIADVRLGRVCSLAHPTRIFAVGRTFRGSWQDLKTRFIVHDFGLFDHDFGLFEYLSVSYVPGALGRLILRATLWNSPPSGSAQHELWGPTIRYT